MVLDKLSHMPGYVIMLEFIIIALVGSAIAGLWDLRTTEVPDEIPALMISVGLFLHYLNAGMTGDFETLKMSLLTGTALLAVGLIMYKKGQWGGADAWILAAVGYLIPLYGGEVFMINYLPNFLIVSAVYMIAYTIILGIRDPRLFGYFFSETRIRWKMALGIPFLFLLISAAIIYSTKTTFYAPFVTSFIMILLLTIFWIYAKVIEKYAFRKKIPASQVKVGDVLEEMLWRGLTAEEVVKLHGEKRDVVVKEGVRFVPVFFLTLVVTLLYGNLLFLLFF